MHAPRRRSRFDLTALVVAGALIAAAVGGTTCRTRPITGESASTAPAKGPPVAPPPESSDAGVRP
jgi:hypothetical protein